MASAQGDGPGQRRSRWPPGRGVRHRVHRHRPRGRPLDRLRLLSRHRRRLAPGRLLRIRRTSLSGVPYDLAPMADVLYPPHALFLFVPLVFVPAIVWWVVPIAVITYAVWRWLTRAVGLGGDHRPPDAAEGERRLPLRQHGHVDGGRRGRRPDLGLAGADPDPQADAPAVRPPGCEPAGVVGGIGGPSRGRRGDDPVVARLRDRASHGPHRPGLLIGEPSPCARSDGGVAGATVRG